MNLLWNDGVERWTHDGIAGPPLHPHCLCLVLAECEDPMKASSLSLQSKCCIWLSSMGVTKELVNEDFLVRPETYCGRTYIWTTGLRWGTLIHSLRSTVSSRFLLLTTNFIPTHSTFLRDSDISWNLDLKNVIAKLYLDPTFNLKLKFYSASLMEIISLLHNWHKDDINISCWKNLFDYRLHLSY